MATMLYAIYITFSFLFELTSKGGLFSDSFEFINKIIVNREYSVRVCFYIKFTRQGFENDF